MEITAITAFTAIITIAMTLGIILVACLIIYLFGIFIGKVIKEAEDKLEEQDKNDFNIH